VPIALLTGPANAGKAEVVIDALRRHMAHGEQPLLIVPTRADTEHYTRELAGEGTALGVRVERFDGLIAEAVRRAQTGGVVLGGLARECVLAAIASGSAVVDADGGARADQPPPAAAGLVHALAVALAELRVRRVSAARLARALEDWAAEDGAASAVSELGRFYREYERTLERLRRVDGEQRAVRALDALRQAPRLWGGTPVLFYGFDDLTPLQIDAIETLGRVVDARVTVSLTYEPGRVAFAGRAATFAALYPLAAEHRELGARADYYAAQARRPLSHLERSLFEPNAARMDPAGAVRLLEGGGERAELELVAREITGLLSDGMAPEEIAVAVRAPGATAELLEEVFSAAGIPYALQLRRRFADTALGGALNGLLRCTPHAADGTDTSAGELSDLMAWLRAPGFLERPELADALELTARRSGAASAAQARALWEQRNWPLETIDQLADAQARGPVALIDRVERELGWIFSAPRRGSASVLGAEELDDARALASRHLAGAI